MNFIRDFHYKFSSGKLQFPKTREIAVREQKRKKKCQITKGKAILIYLSHFISFQLNIRPNFNGCLSSHTNLYNSQIH